MTYQEPASPPPPQKPNGAKKSRRGLGCTILAILTACFAVAVGVFLLLVFAIGSADTSAFASVGRDNYQEKLVEAGTTSQKVAVISVNGIIMSQSYGLQRATSDALIEQIRKAQDDPNVVAVVLDMNTPGGEVTATDEVYHELMVLREDYGKQAVTCMRSVAASGGYYLAAGTDWIVANRLTYTGSIGVIIHGYNATGLMQKIGLESTVYKSGDRKDILSMSRPATPEEQTMLQGMVDETFREFALIVSKGRNIPLEQITDPDGKIGDARIVSGSEAKELGLVDQLGYLEDAYDMARQLAGATGAKVVRYTPRPSFSDLFRAMKGPNPGAAAEKALLDQAMLLPQGRLYYLAPNLR